MEETFIVYAIQHNVTKRIYIGSTTRNLKFRYSAHIAQLKGHRHSSYEMQRDFDEYGDDFTLYRLEGAKKETVQHPYKENCTVQTQTLDEYEWMYRYHTTDPEFGYNAQDKTARKFVEWITDSKEGSFPYKKGLPSNKYFKGNLI